MEWYFVGICCECRKLKSFLGLAVRIGFGILLPEAFGSLVDWANRDEQMSNLMTFFPAK